MSLAASSSMLVTQPYEAGTQDLGRHHPCVPETVRVEETGWS
jgi:hypothetical protein